MCSVTSRASFATNSSRTSRWTSRRSPAVQLWPGAEEARGDRRLGGEIEVGVVEHDDRAVAAELEDRGLARGGRGDLLAGLGRADEADAVRARVAGDLVADRRARPGDEVEDARRQIRLGDALGERDRGDRRRRRGRPDDGVAGGERGRDQLGGHRVRPVPRRDHADHAARAPHEQHALARRDRVRQPALEPLAVLGGVAPVLDELLDLVARLDAQACPGRASACASARRGASRPDRRCGASRRRARTPSCATRRRLRGSPRRSRGVRRRGHPAEPRRSPRRSPASRR